jgi:hypothetical protein
MARYEYMRLPIHIIPDEIIKHYNLLPSVHNGYGYLEIRRGMYGIPQAGIIAQQLLQKRLTNHGYHPSRHTHGLWKHDTRPVAFSLVVDDFGVKYVSREHAQHLIDAIENYYPISTDWDGNLYCGITLAWDHRKREVELSLPGYVTNALHKFQHPAPKRATDSPSIWTRPEYGAKVQYTRPDTTDSMDKDQTLTLQKVCDTFLFYGRAVDPTMFRKLNRMATARTKGTQATMAEMIHFLNYAASHPDSKIRYVARDMVLHVHSNASYLTEQEARSRAGGHFFLSSNPKDEPILNGPILSLVKTIRAVMSSAAEADVGATFYNCKEAAPLRTALAELGHAQPPTPVQVDNATAVGIANRTVKQVRSHAMDMRFYWIQDRIDQDQFHIFWAPAKTNLGDFLPNITLFTIIALSALSRQTSLNLHSHLIYCEGVLIRTP